VKRRDTHYDYPWQNTPQNTYHTHIATETGKESLGEVGEEKPGRNGRIEKEQRREVAEEKE
jgi:hypothetical protein